MSLLEAWSNTIFSTVIGIITQVITFPWFGIHVSLASNVALGLIFMLVSVARNYCVRRFFNWWATRCNT